LNKFFHPAGEALATATPLGIPEGESAHPARTAPVASLSSEETTPATLASVQTKLDVNRASLAELQNVPGIGPVVAQRIIEAWPFKSADDLHRVKGIGAGKRYEKIRPFFN
jgi:competence protein ComEA